MDIETILGSIVLFAICGMLAYKIIKMWWPTFEQRKNLSVPELIDHALNAPAQERMRQNTMYGTFIETLKIRAVNIVLCLASLYAATFSDALFTGIVAYLCIGFVVTKVKGMPTAVVTTKLSFSDRVTIRLYYVWQWPAMLTR